MSLGLEQLQSQWKNSDRYLRYFYIETQYKKINIPHQINVQKNKLSFIWMTQDVSVMVIEGYNNVIPKIAKNLSLGRLSAFSEV